MKKNRAFSSLELIVAMAFFLAAFVQIIDCFLMNLKLPSIDNTAIAMTADFDNCIINAGKIRDFSTNPNDCSEVHCLFNPNLTFKVCRKPGSISQYLGSFEIFITEYPGAKGTFQAFSYINDYQPKFANAGKKATP
jgi:hypothetical protein